MEVLAIEASVSPTNVTIVTTTEKDVIASIVMPQEKPICKYLIRGWAQCTTGTNITAMTAKIRRGTGITGTLVNEANAVIVGATAGSTEVFTAVAEDTQTDVSQVQYSFCLLQVSADGNATVVQSAIEVVQMA